MGYKIKMNIFIWISLYATVSSCLSLRHEMNWDTSKQIANSIRQQLLTKIDQFSDAEFREHLEKDLKEEDDAKREMKQISDSNANQLFNLLKIPDPKCDLNKDHIIKGDELQCLNLIWKMYVPH